ncbi:unnamed protein product [Diatraea saccharalis]|uniref:Uncharacterized protein n=1 Tax=Diatraea saccharalis TaxID=40085 RepID=A0A9N9R9B7_9NEOP|nr:unnamed protein product [Diatraea saccharalis]
MWYWLASVGWRAGGGAQAFGFRRRSPPAFGSMEVYASPSRRKMDTKGEGEEMTYPHICFMVDNFDEVFCDIVVRDGEMVCVELVARGRGGAAQAVIFLGSIRYDALTRVYESRVSK